MNEEKTNTNDPIAELLQQFGARIDKASPRLSHDIAHVTRCKESHRFHTVNGVALRPAKEMLSKKDALPRALWLSCAGGFLVEALRQLAALEEDVYKLRRDIVLVEADRAVMLMLGASADGKMAEVAARTQQWQDKLTNQLLLKERAETIALLQELLRDTDPAVAEAREALRDTVIEFIEEQLLVASTEAGYHTLNLNEMGAQTMLYKAEELIHQVWERGFTFPKGQGGQSEVREGQCGQGEGQDGPFIGQVDPRPQIKPNMSNHKGFISTTLNQALGLAVLAAQELAKKHCLFAPGSTIEGRTLLAVDCLAALAPAESPASETAATTRAFAAVQCRMKWGFERTNKKVSERSEMLGRDGVRTLEQFDRATKAICEVVSLMRALQPR